MIKFLVVGLMCLFSTVTVCQTEYSDLEKEAFVEIYMLNKSKTEGFKKKNDQDLFSKYKITKSRYQEIIKASLAEEELELSLIEQEFISEIKTQNKSIEKRREINVNQLCIEKGISYTRYRAQRAAFKTDINKHDELKPFFQKYILEHGK